MLVLSRKPGEKVVIGDGITLTVVEVGGGRVRLAFDAPDQVRILRAELACRQGEPLDAELDGRPDESRAAASDLELEQARRKLPPASAGQQWPGTSAHVAERHDSEYNGQPVGDQGGGRNSPPEDRQALAHPGGGR
jgi:carbon storage regulator